MQLEMEWNVLTDNGGCRKQVISYAPKKIQAEYKRARQNPAVIHYAGSHKPWKELGGDFAREFWTIARQTPYYEQLLCGTYTYAAHHTHPSAKGRMMNLLRIAAKRILPEKSRIRTVITDIYWRCK